jgi:hypothetical protein
MQNDLFTVFTDFLRQVLSPFALDFLAPYIAIIPFLLLLFVIYQIVVRAVKSSFGKVGMPKEATSGLIFLTRLIFVALGMVSVLTVASPILEGDVIISAGALLGAALGLAFSRSLSNLISGLFILGTRPFHVGDYIKIGDDEGIVLEIALNYTTLLLQDHSRVFVPNVRVVESRVVNTRIKIEDYLTEREFEHYESPFHEKKESVTSKIRDLVQSDEIFRYTFSVIVPNQISRDKVIDHFSKTCQKWTVKFIAIPEFIFWQTNNWGNQIFRFSILLNDPREIFTNGTDFHSEIADFYSA